MKKILIFGTGFIATSLIEYFQNKDKKIEFIVLFNKHKIEGLSNKRQFSMNDDIASLLHLEKPNYIIMLHGNSFVSENISIESCTNDNMLKATSFLEKLYETKFYKNIEKIILVGSASEYGKFYNKPIKEDFPLHPTSLYGLSKILLYNASKYFIDRGLPIIYVRQFNTVGQGQRDTFVFPSFAKNIAMIEKKPHKPVLNVGDLSQERDFIDIRDTCAAYELLMEKGEVGEAYNVASGEYISINGLLKNIIKQSDLIYADLEINENVNLFSKEASLSKRLHADISKIKELGFKRKFTLDETINDVLEYWRQNV